jgi:hypothetical protein
MMQFLWRYVDELVGKGLEINVLAQFFFLSALTLIPLSLPLAVSVYHLSMLIPFLSAKRTISSRWFSKNCFSVLTLK